MCRGVSMSFGFNPNLNDRSTATDNDLRKSKIEAVDVDDDTAVMIDDWCVAKVRYDIAKDELDTHKKRLIKAMNLKSIVGISRFKTTDFELTCNVLEKYEVVDDKELINNVLQNVFQVCGADVANNIINWKPSLNKRIYETLTEDQKSLLNDILTLSYSTPSLTMKKEAE